MYKNKKAETYVSAFFNYIWLIAIYMVNSIICYGLTKLYGLNFNLKTLSVSFDTDNFVTLFTIHF